MSTILTVVKIVDIWSKKKTARGRLWFFWKSWNGVLELGNAVGDRLDDTLVAAIFRQVFFGNFVEK